MIATDGTPEKLQQAFDTAMRNGANAVILNGVDRALVSKQIADAKKRGRGVRDLLLHRVGRRRHPLQHEHPAAERRDRKGPRGTRSVADTKGKANALYVNITAFAILKNLGTLFERSYKSYARLRRRPRSTSR